VEQLREQKKVMHISGFEFLVNEVKIELSRVAEERNALEKAELVKSSDSGKENILSWIVEGIVEECEKILENQKQIPPEKFLDDEEYRKVVLEMLETKSHALSKVRLCNEALKQMGGDGSTPLMLATEKGDVKRVKELIEQKQDIMSKNKLQRTALHVAACSQGLDVENATQVIETLIHNQADVIAKDTKGLTPLHLAAAKGNTAVVQILLKHHRKSINESDNVQRTALHYAAGEGHLETVRALIEASADTSATDSEGKSALDAAVDHSPCQNLLKSIGADGWTPLMRAADIGIESLENYFSCRALLHCIQSKKPFPAWFLETVLHAVRSKEAGWIWGNYDKMGIKISQDKLKIDRFESKTQTSYSCATAYPVLEHGLIHKWSIKVQGHGTIWLGIARAAEEGKGLTSAPGSVGRYMLAFPSDGSDHILIGPKPVFDTESRFKFANDQVLDFELDTNNAVLSVRIDGKVVCSARNVECQAVCPYVCLSLHTSACLLSRSCVDASVDSTQTIDPDESVGLSNDRWTPEMDEALESLPIAGLSVLQFKECTL
jgi:hypothetical protein